jgi:hypothetical protein
MDIRHEHTFTLDGRSISAGASHRRATEAECSFAVSSQSIAHELAHVDPIDDEAAQRAVDAISDAAARR